MQITNGSFISSNGEIPISYVVYAPDKPARAVVQIVHGMCEYISRYDGFMKFLTSKGFVVYGHDQLGHGSTAPTEDDLGYFAKWDGYKFLLDDVKKLKAIASTEQPAGLPYFLLGHSMGSFVARLCANDLASQLTGAIFSGTGGENPLAKTGISIAEKIMRLRGPRHRSLLLDKITFGTYNQRIKPVRTGKDWLSRDSKVVDAYLHDKYNTFVFTASAFRDLYIMNALANSALWFETMSASLPILLFSGDQDPVGGYGAGVRQVYDRLKAAGNGDVTLTLYPGGRHEMLNETNRQEVYEDIAHWLEAHLTEVPKPDSDAMPE